MWKPLSLVKISYKWGLMMVIEGINEEVIKNIKMAGYVRHFVSAVRQDGDPDDISGF